MECGIERAVFIEDYASVCDVLFASGALFDSGVC